MNSQAESQKLRVKRLKVELRWRAFKFLTVAIFLSLSQPLWPTGTKAMSYSPGSVCMGVVAACGHTFSVSTKLPLFLSCLDKACASESFSCHQLPQLREHQVTPERLNTMLPHGLPGTHCPVQAEGFPVWKPDLLVTSSSVFLNGFFTQYYQ